MYAILWRKIKGLSYNRWRLLLFLVLPFAIFGLFYYRGISVDNLIAVFPYIFTGVCTIVFFSIEDLIFSEVILATPIKIKEIWLVNTMFDFCVFTIYGELALTVSVLGLYLLNVISGISLVSITFNMVSLFFVVAMLLASTIHFSDYSKFSQYAASIFAIVNVATPFALLVSGDVISITYNKVYLLAAASALITLIAFSLFRSGNKEKMIINTQSFVEMVNGSENIISE